MSAGGADVPAAGRTSRLIFQQYPAPIRRLYATVVTERSPAARHAKLCKLGEGALAYLASMALSDYRNRRHADPDPKVESVLAGMKRISMGQYLQIFRVATDSIQPALFDYKLSRPDSCPAISRFCAAYSAIEEAIELEAQNLRKIVAQRLEAPRRCAWLAFWERLVEYRNRSEAHPATYNWPVGHADYYSIMTPILESALVEALTAPHVERVFRDHPVATLANITYGQDRYLHEVAGEDLGLPFEAQISLDRSVTDVWSQDAWKARPGSALMLARLPSGAYEISGLMHDLAASGPPPSLAAGIPASHASWWPARGRRARGGPRRRPRRAPAVSSCRDSPRRGVPFHVTCPIAKTATVTVTARPAPEFTITQVDPGLSKIALALRRAATLLELEPLEIRVEHWSDLDVGKGMGSSTADITAASRALAAVADRALSPAQVAKIATSIESSDGSMYPGLVAFNQKTGDVLEQFSWWPQFAVVMITPPQVFNTESANFSGKELLGAQFDDILDSLRTAAAKRDAAAFAQAATRSASINQRFVPNPYYALLEDRADGFGALGINVGHTGTVVGPAVRRSRRVSHESSGRCLHGAPPPPAQRREDRHHPHAQVTAMSTGSHQRQGGDLRGRGPVSLDLSTCVNPYGPPGTVMEALRSLPPEAIRAHPYQAAGDVEAAYAAYLGQPAGQLVAGRGTSDLIWTLARHLDGKTTGLPLPAYTEFRQAFPRARTFGGGPSTHPLEILDTAMRACDAVIISNPHNPTGQLLHPGDLAGIARRHPGVRAGGRRVLHGLPARPRRHDAGRMRPGQRHRAAVAQQVLRPGRSPLGSGMVPAAPARPVARPANQLAGLRIRGDRAEDRPGRYLMGGCSAPVPRRRRPVA